MSTARQTEANRANAAKSTGPRTARGKQNIQVNALRHGLTGRTVLLPADDLDLYRAHVKSLTASLRPEGPEETQLAALIADNYWRLRRIHTIEDGIFARRFAETGAPLATHPLADAALHQAEAYLEHSRELERLTLYEQRIQRSIKVSAARLEALQKARAAACSPTGFEFSDAEKQPAPAEKAAAAAPRDAGSLFRMPESTGRPAAAGTPPWPLQTARTTAPSTRTCALPPER